MVDNSIYPYGYEYPDGRSPPGPKNHDEIQQMLAERRPSLSPSVFPEEEYRRFARADAQVRSEDDARERVIRMIQGASWETNRIGRNTPFNNIANMFPREERLNKDANRGPVNGRQIKPDYYYGAHPDQLPLKVRDDLGDQILPSTDNSRPCVPNFFIEAKGPSGSNAVSLNQACIDGAIGTRGIHELQTYGQQVPTYDNNAYTISATYSAGTLRMYAHHPGQPDGPGTDREYYMNQLNGWFLTGNRKTLLEGMTAFRNCVDWTEAQRNAAIEHAKAVWHAQRQVNTNAHGDLDEEDEEVNERDEEAESNEGDDDAAPADPILTSSTSQSPVSAGQSISCRGKAIRQESDTPADEPTLNLRRDSRSTTTRKAGFHKIRASAHSSVQQTGSTTYVTGGQWAWRNGAFQCFDGPTLLQTQSSMPQDVWVFFEHGWPDGGGKKWRWCLSTTGQSQYQ